LMMVIGAIASLFNPGRYGVEIVEDSENASSARG
jgi:hypothetical protein